MGIYGNYLALDNKTLQQIKNNEIEILDIDPNNHPTLDIDKTWQTLCFMFCGDIEAEEVPMAYIVPMGDSFHIESELEFGAFVLTPAQVKEGYAYIKDMTEEDLRAKYDVNALIEEEIYPSIREEDGDNFFEYLYQNFESIKSFYQKRVKSKQGILFYVS